MRNHRHLIIMAMLASWTANSARAERFDPAAVDTGFMNLVPVLTLGQTYDDNFYRQAGETSEFHLQTLGLQLDGDIKNGPHEYRALYRGNAGFVESSSADNYFDHTARLQGKWHMANRHRFELAGTYEELHDRRGTEYFQGQQAQLIDEPARFRRESAMARYIYGADQARGQLQFELNAASKTYLNFRDLTTASDRLLVEGTTRFLWRLAGSLRGLLETTQGDINYQNDPAAVNGIEDRLDSQHAEYLTGLTWDISGQTSGTLKAGYATKDFADNDRKDFSGGRWSGEINWWPRTYSRLSLMTGQRAEETTSSGDFVDTQDFRIRWQHDWNNRVQSTVGVLYRDETYEADLAGREDDTTQYNLELDYLMRRWLVIGLFYYHEKRESNLASFAYSRDVAGLSLRLGL